MLVKPIESFLKEGEKIILEDKYHPIELIFSIIWTSLFFIISFLLVTNGVKLGYILLLVTIVFEIYFLISYYTTVFVITNSRVFGKTGLIGNYTRGNQLTKIEAVEMNQSIFDRIFNTYSVEVNGVGGDESKSFGALRNADKFYKTLQELTDKTMAEVNDNISSVNVSNLDTTDKLRQAAQLLLEVANSLDNQK